MQHYEMKRMKLHFDKNIKNYIKTKQMQLHAQAKPNLIVYDINIEPLIIHGSKKWKFICKI